MKSASFFFFASIMLCFSFLPGPKVSGHTSTAKTDSILLKIEQYLNNQVAKGFKGNVLVARKGKVAVNSSYGQKEADPHIAYWIASNTKPLMALAIQKLEAQQKINIKDSITNYFDAVPNDKKHITVHQLLTHSSGLPHKYAADGIKDYSKALEAILKLPVDKQKIGQYQYSNDGYNLLALLLEKASGKSYEAFVTENVLKPLGLKGTGFWGFEQGNGLTIAPFFNQKRVSMAGVYNGKSIANYGYKGATGLYSTAEDQYKLFKALQEGNILSPVYAEKAFQPHVFVREHNGVKTYYGYGWVVSYKEGGITNIRHTGDEDWIGHNSMRLFYPDGDAIVVLSNAHTTKDGDLWAVQVAYDIQHLLKTNTVL